jgi:MoaA/NifB/PqqE/SkfB family radical SAM enzyme
LLREWLGSLLSPSLDWIQVEVTSYCNAACIYCPRTVYRDAWLNRNLSLDVFESLMSAFARCQLVFLQGWGEPFLNHDLFTMVRMAKEAGCKVGTTTNGMLLDTGNIHQVVECGVDVLAFSLAGVDERNDAVRKGTSLDRVLETIRILNETKMKLRKERPAVHIAYMLLRSGLEDVKQLALLFRRSGVSEIVVSTLDFVPCEELADETITPSNRQEYEEIRGRLEAVNSECRQWGMRFHYQLRKWGKRSPTCTENVERALFVSADGTVSPCVFANLPVSEGIQMYRDGKRRYQRLGFGNVTDTPVEIIWWTKAYRAFRQAFYGDPLPATCVDCPKLFMG